eukprot:7389196-Prymnesium_polylepis.1
MHNSTAHHPLPPQSTTLPKWRGARGWQSHLAARIRGGRIGSIVPIGLILLECATKPSSRFPPAHVAGRAGRRGLGYPSTQRGRAIYHQRSRWRRRRRRRRAGAIFWVCSDAQRLGARGEDQVHQG